MKPLCPPPSSAARSFCWACGWCPDRPRRRTSHGLSRASNQALSRSAIKMETSNIKQWRAFWEDERNSAALYRALADAEKNQKIAEVYRRLAATEESHANTWAAKLKATNVSVPVFKPAWRTRVLIWAARRFG